MLSEFKNPTRWERRQPIGSLHCNLWLLRCGCNPGDCPRSCRSHLDRPPRLQWVRGSLDPDCGMCSSYIRQARVGTNCKNIYRMRPCFGWGTVVILGCPLFSIFVSFSLLFLTRKITFADWILSMAYCSLPSVWNWKDAAYRGTSRVPAVDNDTVKEDTAVRRGMTRDGNWWQATGPDLQASTITENRHLRYNNLSKSRPEEDLGKWKMAIKFSSRPTQKVHSSRLGFGLAAAQLSTAKHKTQARRGNLWLSASSRKEAVISDVNPHNVCAHNDAIWSLEWFVVIIVLTWVRLNGNVDFSAEGWNKHRLKQNT
jgi:hypothetical protein